MAGNLNSDSVLWNVGDTLGKAPGGASAAIPSNEVQTGAGAPSGAPTNNSPFYVNTSNNKLYAWSGSTWVAISGANT